MFIVKKQLNNNVILAEDEFEQEVVLIGDGIGFGTKPGRPFYDEKKIKKIFSLQDKNVKRDFQELVKEADPKLVAIVEEQIYRMQRDFDDVELNENLHTTLLEHIIFAIERKTKDLEFNQPFAISNRYLYEREYMLALELVYALKVNYGVELSQGEVEILSVHIHSARINKSLNLTKRTNDLIQETFKLVQEHLKIKIDTENKMVRRFVIHMQFAFDRITKGEYIENELSDEIKNKFPEDYQTMKEILLIISRNNDLYIADSEVCYMTLYLTKLRRCEDIF